MTPMGLVIKTRTSKSFLDPRVPSAHVTSKIKSHNNQKYRRLHCVPKFSSNLSPYRNTIFRTFCISKKSGKTMRYCGATHLCNISIKTIRIQSTTGNYQGGILTPTLLLLTIRTRIAWYQQDHWIKCPLPCMLTRINSYIPLVRFTYFLYIRAHFFTPETQ